MKTLILGLIGATLAGSAFSEGPRVVATTSIVGDVVRRIAGATVDVDVLLPPGCDPHAYQPTPKDVGRLAGGSLIFINGLDLEEGYLPGLLRQSRSAGAVVDLSAGIHARHLEEMEHGAEHDHDHGEADPHVWFDPENVLAWTRAIEEALDRVDAAGHEERARNAQGLRADLALLDPWIREQVANVPPARRKLVTDHDSLGYFAARYGFTIVGAVIPGFSSGAEPSAREMAALEQVIRRESVPAIFVSRGQPAGLARRIASDTGAAVIELDTCALQENQSYVQFIRQNVSSIVEALR